MKNIKRYAFIVCLFLLAVSGYTQESNFKIIVNEGNEINSITSDQVSRIFLKKMTKWDNGVKISPVDLAASSDLRENFTKKIHGKSISAINAYWQKKIFTGKGVPPIEQSSEKDVIEFVKNNPGAIGYVSANTNTSGVKVLKVVK